MSQSSDSGDEHHDLRRSAMIKSQDSVQRAMKAVESVTIPFTIEPSKLVMLASGATVPADLVIEKDVLQADEAEKTQQRTFITGSQREEFV